uniref:RxLR effector candidate protein n=1 Tax=Hyaloperonospora arabidopsidis (strain Emoy2) TaxID=559515 RepID=M4B2E4_HYAAE
MAVVWLVYFGINSTTTSAFNLLRVDIAEEYSRDTTLLPIIRFCRNTSEDALRSLPASIRAQITRYCFDGQIPSYKIDQFDAPRIVGPLEDDLRGLLLHEYHDGETGGHLRAKEIAYALTQKVSTPKLRHDYSHGNLPISQCLEIFTGLTYTSGSINGARLLRSGLTRVGKRTTPPLSAELFNSLCRPVHTLYPRPVKTTQSYTLGYSTPTLSKDLSKNFNQSSVCARRHRLSF